MENLSKITELLNLLKTAMSMPSLPALPSHKTITTPSMTPSGGSTKIPGTNPSSNKDPVKVAQQLKAGQPTKPKIKTEMMKTAENGQWSIEEQ